VPEQGHFQLEAGTDVSIPTGTITKVIDAAEVIDDQVERKLQQGEDPTAEELHRLLEAGANLALNPPAVMGHFGVAFAPLERWEIAVRRAAGAWRLGVRHQLFDKADDGIDMSVGLGASRGTVEFPVSSILETLEFQDFTRYNVELPIVVGGKGDFYRWWTGPRLVYTHMSTGILFGVPGDQQELFAVRGSGFYVGAQFGAAIGYRWIFIAAELTLAQLFADADIGLGGSTTNVDLDSFIIHPGIGLMAEF
jgi:hypothetical protein